VHANASHRPLFDHAYGGIKGLILSGELRPGQAVSEVELATQLSVSRTPVREAIRQLITENLIEIPATGGPRVYAPTIVDVAETYCARAGLEDEAATLAAIFKTPEFLDDMDRLVAEMLDASRRQDIASVSEINRRFHMRISAQCHNSHLARLLEALDFASARYRRMSLFQPLHLQRSIEEHEELCRLFRVAAPQEVGAYCRRHIMQAGARVVRAALQMEGTAVASQAPLVRMMLSRSE